MEWKIIMNAKIKKILKTPEFSSYVLFFLCWIVYCVICFGKNSFSAANAAIVKEGLFTKDSLGLIGAGFYLFYSVGQFLGAGFIDKASPHKFISLGLIASVLSCIIIVFTDNFYIILISWCLNGLLQFAFYPACITIISTKIHKDFRRKSLTYFSFTIPIGTLISYLVSSMLLTSNRWTSIFMVSAIVTIISLLVWLIYTKNNSAITSKSNVEKVEKEKVKVPWKKLISVGLIPMSIGAFIKSSLDLGTKAWIPTMLMETYDLSASFSVFLTIFMVIINITGVFVADYIIKKVKGNEVKAASKIFLISLPFIAGLLFMKNLNLYLSVTFMSIFTTLMSAITQVVLFYAPVRFVKYGCVGTTTSILNAFSAFGTFVSTYLFGLIAEHFGWTSTIITWIVFALVGFIVFALASPRWKKFINNTD